MNRRNFIAAVGGALMYTNAAPSLGQYVIPDGQVRLVFNENPYGPSPRALAAAKDVLSLSAYYPDSPSDFPIRDNLFDAISKKHQLVNDNLFVSSGSNEGLQAALLAYGQDGAVLTPALTYNDHLGYAERLGVSIVRVPLRDDLQVDLDAMAARVDENISVVYLANPNNPTGVPIDPQELRVFCDKVGEKALVIIDEAYNELMPNPPANSMVDKVRTDNNVLVMRTFSKIFGMAGMRIGYGMARPDIIERVSKHVMSWPNGVGLTAAYHSYIDDEFIAFSRQKVSQGRAMVNQTFLDVGVIPVPSVTNFVFADIGRDAKAFRRAMASEGVLVNGGYAGYPNYLRVSMGKIEDLRTFDRVFKRVFSKAG